ncbi:MAG: peptidylprolyl isomerase [bacterium]
MHLRLALTAAAIVAAAPAALRAQVPATTTATPALQPAGTKPVTLPLDRVVAVVGDAIITQSNLQERLIQKRADGVTFPTDTVAFRAFALSVANELVDEELLLQKGKELKVEIPDVDVNSTVDKQFKDVRKKFGSDAEFRSELSKAGYGTPEEYKKFLADGIKRNETITRTIKKLREDGKMTQANITDAEVAEAYERTKASMPKREAAVTWRQIIIPPKPSPAAKEFARVKAESLLAELKSGGDFEKLAKRESQDPGSKDNGGDLGWNRRGKMVPAFDRWMFSLAPGVLSPVVESPFGFHIIRVDRAMPAEVKARHILITPKIDSLDVARSKLEADSVVAALQAGAPFDSLAKKHHDFASGEETTLLTPFPRSQLPAAYQQAFGDKKAKDVVEFAIAGNTNVPSKYVVAQIASVEQGGDMTLEEVKERFRSRLAEEGGVKRLMEALRKATYVSVRKDAIELPVAVAPGAAPAP